MNICRYLYCTIVCCITTLTFRIVNAKNEDVRSGSFKTKGSTIILQSENTTDVYSMSLISCADMCLSDPQCCVASYLKGTSTCRIDTSARCCVETKPLTGWRFIEKKSYLPITCTGCISFCNSLYSIVEDPEDWTKAKEKCEDLGGNLLEIETSDENIFIKEELISRNTGVNGYWIGGYNFLNDTDMEWVGRPNQPMSFNDMGSGEPNHPESEACMVMWRGFDFQWGDYTCGYLLSYICEFMQR